MQQIESQIADLLRSRIKGARPEGLIKCTAGDGTVGGSGTVTTGFFRRKKLDMHDLLDHRRGPPDFYQLLSELREASLESANGPWYRCNIELAPRGEISFRYFWENTPFTTVKELELDDFGHVPNFVLARRFDKALIDELTDFDVGSSLLFYVPSRVAAGKPISDPLLEVYATLEWQTDVNNGAMDQYFARDHEPMTGLERIGLYAETYRGLLRIGCKGAAALFAESIALYAHFHPRVEQSRAAMAIPAVPRQEQSDIMGRYYEMSNAVDEARVRYIRQCIEELEQES